MTWIFHLNDSLWEHYQFLFRQKYPYPLEGLYFEKVVNHQFFTFLRRGFSIMRQQSSTSSFQHNGFGIRVIFLRPFNGS